MLGQLRRQLTYANVMATVAVFLALGAGAYAVTTAPKNSVASRSIKDGQVKSPDLANGAVTSPKLACKGNSAQDKMVRAGSVCIDRYEDSIWTNRSGGAQITGAIPCNLNGQDCKGKIFARSVKGVAPRADITWFQAQQALANSGKRLPTNAEWQQAVAGTPDSSACNVSTGVVANTGANAGCVSRFGAFDMVGNLYEWVADWVPLSTTCVGALYGGDENCIGGASTTFGPGALVRGGTFGIGASAGPFAVTGANQPSSSNNIIGFRGAR